MFFIPARAGSERIAHKNMRLVAGKPLIAWTFDALARLDEKIVPRETLVSTDDPEVVSLAAAYGFTAVERPAHLAESKAKMSEVLRYHASAFDQAEICVLYPTSPLRTMEHIAAALALWTQKGATADCLMSVTEVGHRPFGLLRVGTDEKLHCAHAEGERYYQAQGQPPLYRANGAIYILPVAAIQANTLNSQLFVNHTTLPYLMDERSSLEVDTEEDLELVEFYLAGRPSLIEVDPQANGQAR